MFGQKIEKIGRKKERERDWKRERNAGSDAGEISRCVFLFRLAVNGVRVVD